MTNRDLGSDYLRDDVKFDGARRTPPPGAIGRFTSIRRESSMTEMRTPFSPAMDIMFMSMPTIVRTDIGRERPVIALRGDGVPPSRSGAGERRAHDDAAAQPLAGLTMALTMAPVILSHPLRWRESFDGDRS
jgi:hypothetical protein